MQIVRIKDILDNSVRYPDFVGIHLHANFENAD